MAVENPVLFITFARPDYARQSFDAIKRAKPKKLYFYNNKGRNEKPEEIRNNNIIRAFTGEIDWDCEVKTFFREEYVDVYTSLRSAIDWVFANEEQAIILEEDCVASLAFFDFADKMLLKFKDEQRVWMISGDNFVENYNPSGNDYHFTHMMEIYGWASWRDRWSKCSPEGFSVDEIIDNGVIDSTFVTKTQRLVHKMRLIFNKRFLEKTKCWDFVFFYTGICNGALSVFPSRNLVHNIGVSGSHHDKAKKDLSNLPVTYNNSQYIITKSPKFIISDSKMENKIFKKIVLQPLISTERIMRNLKKIAKHK